jgi:hypothetical protein
MIAVLLAVLIVGTPAAAADCSREERWLTGSLETAQFAKEPEGLVQTVFETASRALQRCPDSEGLAYLRVRSAELGRGVLVGSAPPGGSAELRDLAAKTAERFSGSARILTVAARVSRDERTARRALVVSPDYLPARVVLADILVDRGDWRQAERVLGDGRGLEATSDGLVVLARVQLAKGDARRARAAAKRALARRTSELIEPDAGDPRPRLRAEEVARQAEQALRSGTRRARP